MAIPGVFDALDKNNEDEAKIASALQPASTPIDYADLVRKAYGNVGRTLTGEGYGQVTQPEIDWWKNKLVSGEITPEKFQPSFSSSVSEYLKTKPEDPYSKYVSGYAVNKAYQDVFGRTPETSGADYWAGQLKSGALGLENLAQNIAYGAQGLDRVSAQKYLGKELWAPEEYLKGTGGQGYQDIANYLYQYNADPTRAYQYAAKYGIDPDEILQAWSKTGGTTLPARESVQSYLDLGRSGFEPRFQNIVSSTFGSPEERASLEKSLGLEPGGIASQFVASTFANKSIEDIEKELQTSNLNKYQEATKFATVAQNLYGLSKEDAVKLGSDLYKGTATDKTSKKFYDEMLSNGLTPELETKILKDAAVNAPNSPYFQQNPDALKIYRPLGELKQSQNAQAGQYGYVNNAPILSAAEADRLLAGDPYKGGNKDFNYFEYAPGDKDNKLGWVLGSKYASSMANGAGVFGLKASTKDINEFDRIEKEIAKGGGIQTVNYGEGPLQVVNVEMIDPETGQKYMGRRNLENFFPAYNEEGMSTGRGYQDYQNARSTLEKGAAQLGLDASKYSSIKDLYDAVNDKSKDLYVVTGRANRWDPNVAAQQGITGVGQSRGGVNHATVMYRKVGDKLVPVQTLKTFNFDDPNTSRGFFGDLAGGIGSLLSNPVVQVGLAFAGGLPNLFANMAGVQGGAAGLASAIGTNLGFQGATANLVGGALLNAGTSGIVTGLTTGDLGKAGQAALAGGIGAGIAGGLPMLDVVKDLNLPPSAVKLGSEILGGAAASKITGQDPAKYAVNRLLSAGLSAMTGMAANKAGIPTTGPGANLAKAMLPIITSKKVRPQDLPRLASALKAYKTIG